MTGNVEKAAFWSEISREVERMGHLMFMANAHATWEMLYGTPCGPYDERRAGNPRGIMDTTGGDR